MYHFSNSQKKEILDILAYLLWDKSTNHEYMIGRTELCKRLYIEIMRDLREQVAQLPSQDVIKAINAESFDSGMIMFLEKRLDLIEEFTEKRARDSDVCNKSPNCHYRSTAILNDLETAKLTKAFLEYIEELEEMVIKLRSEVNVLTAKNELTPYPQLRKDIRKTFHDYLAYIHYRFFFEPELF